MSTLRGPAQLADLQGALCVPTYNITHGVVGKTKSTTPGYITLLPPPNSFPHGGMLYIVRDVAPIFSFLPLLTLDPFTTGNPFLGTKLLGFSIGRGSGALKRSRAVCM